MQINYSLAVLGTLSLLGGTTTSHAALINPGFESGGITVQDPNFDASDAGLGWRSGGNTSSNQLFDIVDVGGNNVAEFVLEDASGFRYLGQVINGAGLTGEKTLTFDLFSNDTDVVPSFADQNNFTIEVFGTNDASFELKSDNSDNGLTELYDSGGIGIGGQSNFSQSFAVPVDFRAGFDFIAVRIGAQLQSNVNNSGGPSPDGDFVRFDNVNIVPIPEPTSALAGGLVLSLLASRRRR
jgi:hypothetical protein